MCGKPWSAEEPEQKDMDTRSEMRKRDVGQHYPRSRPDNQEDVKAGLYRSLTLAIQKLVQPLQGQS